MLPSHKKQAGIRTIQKKIRKQCPLVGPFEGPYQTGASPSEHLHLVFLKGFEDISKNIWGIPARFIEF